MTSLFRVKHLGFSSGAPLVVIDDGSAAALGVRAHDRLLLRKGGREVTAIVNVALQMPADTILVNEEVARSLNLSEGDVVEIEPAPPPRSSRYIRELIDGAWLNPQEIRTIVEDIVRDRLSDIELAALVVAVSRRGLSVEEAYQFSRAMVETGERLDLGVKPVLDKHSIGGIPGDKTTLLVVPILASLGYYVPKTSSRAITSPAGTADRAEVLMPVNLSLEEIKRVVLKVGGCIAWGGALRLAPADDKIIRVEHPLSIDPFLVPSIIAKKAAVGATHVVLDIPVGRGAKVGTMREAEQLARMFIEVARRMGIQLTAVVTFGDQPLGNTAGPALEAREALLALSGQGPADVVDKATSLVGSLLELIGVTNGKALALEAIRSGKALAKLREIIREQGGDPNVKPEDLPVGEKTFTIYAERDGVVTWVNNTAVATLARLAGAPKDKGAGVLLHAKLGDVVKKGDPLLTVHSEHSTKLQAAEAYLETATVFEVGRPGLDTVMRKIVEPVLPIQQMAVEH
ncbi:MAG: AMP phosphorylase [Thermofilaceae archaeon]